MKSLQTILSTELRELGFQRKGRNLFFKAINDVIGLISIEKPTGLTYLQFAIVPLFLPCPGNIYYTYGRRLNEIYSDLPLVDGESTEEELKDYCQVAVQHIKDELLPLLESYSTATALRRFVENQIGFFRKGGTRFISCTPEEMKYLYMYSCLYEKDYEKVISAFRKYTSHVMKTIYWTEALKAKKISESKRIIEALSNEKYSELQAMLENNRAENTNLFTNPHTNRG